MKRLITTAFLISAFTVIPAQAESKKQTETTKKATTRKPAAVSPNTTVGLGAVIGAPTGFSLNLFTAPDQSIQNIAGWYLGDDEKEFALTSHYTWRRYDFETAKDAAWFYGIGGGIILLDKTNQADNPDGNEFEIGPSVTAGMLYDVNPMELFLKSNLTFTVVQNTGVRADLMLGLNFNF